MGQTTTSFRSTLFALAMLAAAGCNAEGGRGGGGAPGLGDGSTDEGNCQAPPGHSCEVPVCDDPCGYNDAEYESADCRIPEYELECGDMRGVKITFQKGGATVPPPNAFFRGKDKNLQRWIEQRWQEMADFTIPAGVKTQIEGQGVEIHNYPAGNDWTRTDFHAGIMALPPGERPENLLRRLANDPIKTTGNNLLAGWVGWPAASGDRKVGDIVDLDIYGPDNGAIAYWKIDTDRFCVITVENDASGWHPVSGIRCWGFVPIQVNPNWKLTDNRWNCGRPTYMFYTMGIDSPTVVGGGTFGGVAAQRGTWNGLIKDLSVENQKAGGVSGRWMKQITIAQPNSLKPGGTTKVKPPGEPEGYYVSLPKDDFREGEVCEAPDLACAAEQYTCGDASCIPMSRRCDGNPDCLDGEDEDSCDGSGSGDSCDGNQFACSDGTCIPEDWRCDGEYEDCDGGEDEQGCGSDDAPSGCEAGEFTCGDGSCIPGAWKCDGEYADCPDGEDEDGCDGGGEPPGGDPPGGDPPGGDPPGTGSCAASEWACNDGSCIPADWQCDGEYVDCPGGEDEDSCDDAPPPSGGGSCEAGQWACSDGTCIPQSYQCDVYVDCPGGEDEDGC